MINEMGRLETNSRRLNTASDILSQSLEYIEEAVNKLHIGMEVGHQGWFYGRIQEKTWGFYKTIDGQRHSLMQLPRDERVLFSLSLGGFLNDLADLAGQEAAKIEQANEILEVQLRRLSEDGNR